MKNPFSALTKFECVLYAASLTAAVLSFVLSGGRDPLTLVASLIGATALIFVAKGYVIGQVLTVVFAVFYGIISFYQRYYGEMITYLGMSAPMAVCAAVAWLKNPYRDTAEVKVHKLTRNQFAAMAVLTVFVTIAFWFILRALGNASLTVSTISVTTSFLASYLTFFRSPYYALAYAANDIVLIVLWIIASLSDSSCLPMIICFVAFLANDLYGFYNWRRMQLRQKTP